MNEMSYKGYKAEIRFSAEENLLVGQVVDVDALILFSASSVAELQAELRTAIDEYLSDCAAEGLEPERPCKGSFNVRVGSNLHRRMVGIARKQSQSLNEFVRIACAEKVERAEREAPVGTVDKMEFRGEVPAFGYDQVFGPHGQHAQYKVTSTAYESKH